MVALSSRVNTVGENGNGRRTSGRSRPEGLKCLAEGSSNKVIALRHCLAEATVKIHVKNILRKLKTQNRTQAALWARENGIYG